MSSWDVYWILQLDAINSSAHVISVVSGLALVCSVVVEAIAAANKEETTVKRFKLINKLMLSLFLISLFTVAFVPKTKQMAVIIILPKVASEENIKEASKEGKVIYGLMKSWLKGKIEDTKETVKKEIVNGKEKDVN